MSIPLVAVVGPTASGKTALAIELAKRYNGEIVSADSMQIYRGMDIATAKPTVEEMEGIPHHLIGFLDPEEGYSVAQFLQDARAAIDDITARGKLPIVAGGTGLYVDSLVQQIELTEMENDPALRAELERRSEEEGPQALWEELRAVDPETAASLHPNNRGRVIRALEVYRLTGEPISVHRQRSRSQPSPYNACIFGLDYTDRQRLYDRIDLRVDRMMENGLLEECREQISLNLSDTAAQAIGYKELAPYFSGLLPLEECVENLKRATRRYAKRQLTWFRRNQAICWLYPDRQTQAEIFEIAEKQLAFLYTV